MGAIRYSPDHVTKTFTFYRHRSALGALFAACTLVFSALGADTLFNDPIIVKAKSFQIRESDLQDAYVSQKAAAAALGRPSPGDAEKTIKKQLLDKMIAT